MVAVAFAIMSSAVPVENDSVTLAKTDIVRRQETTVSQAMGSSDAMQETGRFNFPQMDNLSEIDLSF